MALDILTSPTFILRSMKTAPSGLAHHAFRRSPDFLALDEIEPRYKHNYGATIGFEDPRPRPSRLVLVGNNH